MLLWAAGLGACLVPVKVGEVDAPPGPEEGMTLGAWAASLDVPPCSDGGVLVVDTLEDEMDGVLGLLVDRGSAGERLSFREALHLSANRPGPDTILFDAELFPPSAPAKLVLNPSLPLPDRVDSVCIDGRSRGVVLDWSDTSTCQGCPFWLAENSLLVGLDLRPSPFELNLHGSQVAGCRISTLVSTKARPGAVIGPGNILSALGGGSALVVEPALTSPLVEVRGNWFGHDPLRGTSIELGSALLSWGPLVVRDNVVAHGQLHFINRKAGQQGLIQSNSFGALLDGGALSSATGHSAGVLLEGPGWAFGPGNVLRGSGRGVSLVGESDGGLAGIQAKQNSISGTGYGIRLLGADAGVAPILGVQEGIAHGRCDSPGEVELFADPAGEGELFLGKALCVDGGWTLAVPPTPPGYQLTTTFTDSQRAVTGPFSAPFDYSH